MMATASQADRWKTPATVCGLVLPASAWADPAGLGGRGVTAFATLIVVEFVATLVEAAVYGLGFRMNFFLALGMSVLANAASYLGTPVAAFATMDGFSFQTYAVLITLGIAIETVVVVVFASMTKLPSRAPADSLGSSLKRIALTCVVLNFVSIFFALTVVFMNVEGYGRV